MCLLKGDAFKLWIFLDSNQNGYSFFLSKVDCQSAGITNYRRAVEELQKRSFLVDNGKNNFTFYELPDIKENDIAQIEHIPCTI